MTLVYLIRHGATAINREIPYRLQGRVLDPPLDDGGREQARRTGEALRDRPIAAVYSGPLLRARQTAEAVAIAAGLGPEICLDLTEADLGAWEGLTWEQARASHPEQHAEFMARPGTTPYPGGESFERVAARVSPAIAELAGRHAGASIAIVGHNVVNRAYLAALIGLPIDRARGIKQSNCGINVVRYDGPTPSLVTLNSTLHLDDPAG